MLVVFGVRGMYRRFFTWYERVQLLRRKNKVEGGREGGRKEEREL